MEKDLENNEKNEKNQTIKKIKLVPILSYDYNKILNPKLNEKSHLSNFASLISDKDRMFLHLSAL